MVLVAMERVMAERSCASKMKEAKVSTVNPLKYCVVFLPEIVQNQVETQAPEHAHIWPRLTSSLNEYLHRVKGLRELVIGHGGERGQ